MIQVLRYLIVIISLIPSCLCFGQENANKDQSSSSAQNQKTELKKSDSVDIENPLDALPPRFRMAFTTVRKVELPPEANSWAIQIISGGGIRGKGNGNLTITSQGQLVWNAKENHCNVKLRDDLIQTLTQTAFSAHASKWSGPTNSYCSDCFVYAMVLQRRENDGRNRTYVAYWDESTDKDIPKEVRKVYETFMAHKECQQ